MSEFLTEEQLKALERAIAEARAFPGVHRIEAPDGEDYAYQLRDEIVGVSMAGPMTAISPTVLFL
jgi:hypothetical protein